MIRTFEVVLNAAHPELPLFEASGIIGSPSTAFIKRVPASVGSWHITKVYVEAAYPDNTSNVVEARVGAEGIYTATLPACAMSGRVRSGFVVYADGIDEAGDPITGYMLGVADMAIYTRDLRITPGFNGVAMHYFDNPPSFAKKGDVAPFADVLKMFDGAAWVAFGSEVDLSDYYTKEETDAEINKLAAYYITYSAAGAAFPTHAALANATVYYSGGAVRVPTRNDYAVVLADETHGNAEWRYIYAIADGASAGQWEAQYPIETNDYSQLVDKPSVNNVELSGNKTAAQLGLASAADATLDWRGPNHDGYTIWTVKRAGVDVTSQISAQPFWDGDAWDVSRAILPSDGDSTAIVSEPETALSLSWSAVDTVGDHVGYAATRTVLQGLDLGSQTDKPVASEAEAEALRTGKADKVASATNGNVATLDAEGNILDGGVSTATLMSYALGDTITASAILADRTMNKAEPAADNTSPISLSFPASVAGKSRNFYAKVTNTRGNSGAISFNPPSGARIYGDAFQQAIASGETWLFHIREVAANEFFAEADKLVDPLAPLYWGLYFEAEASNVVVNMSKTGSPSAVTLATSTDGTTWTTFDADGTTPVTLANIGDRVYFRAGVNGNTAFASSDSNYYTFTLSGAAGAHGNIMSLLGDNESNATISTSSAFRRLFYGCTNLTTAPALPATTLADDCYNGMFSGCTGLLTVPELPATTLASGAYSNMFKGCTGITVAPALPATTLANFCYYQMFEDCSSLTTAPATLPALSVGTSAYQYMFRYCSNLVTAPEILATQLASYSSGSMFYGCTMLGSIKVAFTDWGFAATNNWVLNVSATGTFYCPAALGDNETIARSVSACPSGWTVINT